MPTEMRGSAALRGYWFGKPGSGRSFRFESFVPWLDTWHLFGASKRWVPLEPAQDTALCVALKLLQRGELTPQLSGTEQLLFEGAAEHPNLDDSSIHPAPPAPWTAPFDSPREEKFWNWLTETIPSLAPYLLPQAPFEWLTDNNAFLGQRVDFLVWLPGLRKGIVVEIDDPDKDKVPVTRAQKQGRDAECVKLGIPFFRIPNAEIDSGFSAAAKCQALCAFLSAQAWLKENAGRKPDPGKHRILWLPILSARVQIALLEAVGHGLLPVAADKWVIEITQGENWRVAHAALAGLVTLLERLEKLYQCSILPRSIVLHSRAGNRFNRRAYTSDRREWASAGKGPRDAAHCSLRLLSPGEKSELVQPTTSSWVIGSAIPGTVAPRLLRFPRKVKRPRRGELSASLLSDFLREILGFEQFRPHQEDIVWRTLAGMDSVVLLPTAFGKSLVYQLPSLLLPGSAVVIAPLKSLMADQTRMLKARGIGIALAPHAADSIGIRNMLEETGFIFLAPERLRTVKFLLQIQAAVAGSQLPVCVVVLDETHCVSEWGHDFRVMYLDIGTLIRAKFGTDVSIPALTGTASHWVLTDVRREIGSRDAQSIIEARNMDRKELRFGVVSCSSTRPSKLDALSKTLKHIAVVFGFAGKVENMLQPQGDDTPSGVIFCRTKNECAKVMEFVKDKLKVKSCEVFHGKLPEAKIAEIQDDFLENRIALLISTKAFGMGVDKPNIRFIVHYNLPGSIESWYQEVGRAGRDGKSAICVALYSDPPLELADLLRPTLNLDEVRERYGEWVKKNPYAKWDEELAGLLHFHLGNFPGVAVEVADAVLLWRCLEKKGQQTLTASVSEVFGETDPNDPNYVKVEEQKNQKFQKALHRLACIGLVVEFSIAGKSAYALQLNPNPHPTCMNCLREAIKAFVARYDPGKADEVAEQVGAGKTTGDLLKSAINILVGYTYSVFEKRRRFAIAELLNLLKSALIEPDVAKRNQGLHRSVRAYLEAGPVKDLLIKFIEGSKGRWSLDGLSKIIEQARREDKVMWEHGIAWIQGEFPENSALALLRGLVQHWKGEPAHQSLLEGLRFLAGGSGNRHLAANDRAAIVGKVLDEVAGHAGNVARPLLRHVETLFPKEVVDLLAKRWGGDCRCGFTPAKELRAWACLRLLEPILAGSKSSRETLGRR